MVLAFPHSNSNTLIIAIFAFTWIMTPFSSSCFQSCECPVAKEQYGPVNEHALTNSLVFFDTSLHRASL